MKAQSRAGLEEEQELELGQARTRGKPAENFFDKQLLACHSRRCGPNNF